MSYILGNNYNDNYYRSFEKHVYRDPITGDSKLVSVEEYDFLMRNQRLRFDPPIVRLESDISLISTSGSISSSNLKTNNKNNKKLLLLNGTI